MQRRGLPCHLDRHHNNCKELGFLGGGGGLPTFVSSPSMESSFMRPAISPLIWASYCWPLPAARICSRNSLRSRISSTIRSIISSRTSTTLDRAARSSAAAFISAILRSSSLAPLAPCSITLDSRSFSASRSGPGATPVNMSLSGGVMRMMSGSIRFPLKLLGGSKARLWGFMAAFPTLGALTRVWVLLAGALYVEDPVFR
mmetsp:Transcript_26863/g.58616  ORF Transcript_26863/g.58616 Transcript_26863/m.58616 type:complete len:201 (-) Transcript_26863:362-964(-)